MNFIRPDAYAPKALAVLRVMAALLLLSRGAQTFFDIPPSGNLLRFPLDVLLARYPLYVLITAVQIVAGFLIVIGLFTRSAAFAASGAMATAYWLEHGRRGSFPTVYGGEAELLFCFVFLYLIFAGPGAWCVDGKRGV